MSRTSSTTAGGVPCGMTNCFPGCWLNDLTIVTNNRSDWLGLLGESELHPGVIVNMENAPRAVEIERFTRVMVAIAGLSGLVNTAVEVSAGGAVRADHLP